METIESKGLVPLTPPPSPDEQRAAVTAGAAVRFGRPTLVDRGAAGWCALDLAAAHRGATDPWYVCATPLPPVVDLQTVGDRGVYVQGLPVGADDLGAVTAAIAAAPGAGTRHAAASDAARRRAGEWALAVTDAMVRARLLDVVDGWAALRDAGTVIDTDPEHGELIDPPESLELECRICVVRCPSTGRTYALRVPARMETAREARLWTFGDDWGDTAPEVET